MSEMTRDESNRKIAEALGFRQGKVGGCLWVKGQDPEWHHPSCECKDGDSKCACVSGDEPSGCEYCSEDCAHLHLTECGIDLPDFFNSEEANALVLEAIRQQKHVTVSLVARIVKVCIKYKRTPLGRRGSRWKMIYAEDLDRKTAICEAFKAWKGIV